MCTEHTTVQSMLLSLLPLRQYCKRALTPGALNVASYSFTLPYKRNHKAIVTGDSLSGLEDAPSPTESYSGKKNYYNIQYGIGSNGTCKFRYHALSINQALRKNITTKIGNNNNLETDSNF